MSKIRVLLETHNSTTNDYYQKWLDKDFEYVCQMENADLIIIAGSGTISPALFSHDYINSLKNTSQAMLEYREDLDLLSVKLFVQALLLDKPIVGINRGAHIVAAMNGCSLIQEIDRHYSTSHAITTSGSNVYKIKSNHSQMMYPFDLKAEEYDIVAWARNVSTKFVMQKFGQNTNLAKSTVTVEPEILYFNKTHSLAIQNGAENGSPTDCENILYGDYLESLVDKMIFGKMQKHITNSYRTEDIINKYKSY